MSFLIFYFNFDTYFYSYFMLFKGVNFSVKISQNI